MIFLDTGYLLALFNPSDQLRERAMDWSRVLREPCLVTEYVLWECVNAFSRPADRSAAQLIVAHLRSESGYEIEWASSELFEAGLQLHRERPDKSWSLTDCISFHVMQKRGIRQALAYDEHF
jgi:uncharacterized protein